MECMDYVKDYIMKRGYVYDLDIVAKEARHYARTVQLVGDGNDICIFYIDETLLLNLPYYVDHGFGLEVFDGGKFDKWVQLGSAPALRASLMFYKGVLDLGFKERSEEQRGVTKENLRRSGIEQWDRLMVITEIKLVKRPKVGCRSCNWHDMGGLEDEESLQSKES
ncbi:Acid phosphatase 1 [Nymphaea thermarum]|nr:Acid phosphatase 1 [Nymphaea thermarum]